MNDFSPSRPAEGSGPIAPFDDTLQDLFNQAQSELGQVINQLRSRVEELVEMNQDMRSQLEEHQRAQQELRRAKEEAEAANHTKDKFVNLVAHDLKSPLSAQQGLLELILDDDTTLPPNQKELLVHAVNSTKGLIHLIEELLDISRLQSGKIAIKPAFFEARTLVETLFGRIQALADKKGITLNNQVPPGTRLRADPTLFGEVIQNFLSNAIKFSRAGDTITVGSASEGQERVALEVADQGIGMPQPLVEHLFRIDKKTSRPGTAGESGTGFGLPYCHDLMQAHGGHITVDSAPGQGSRFRAWLPLVRPKVLVVDDLQTARSLFINYLRPLDVDTFEAADGEQAVAMAAELRPHLIISDIIMPRLDGFGMLRQLKGHPALAEVPVIMVTTDEKMETRDRAFSLGANDFVVKPVVVHDFIPRVRHLVG